MTVIAKRSIWRQIFGLLCYLAVTPMVVGLPAFVGFLLGGIVAPELGFDADRGSDLGAQSLSIALGIPMLVAFLREAWSRVFSEVRLCSERIEFLRFGSTTSWFLADLQSIRLRSQSTDIQAPDGKRLNLTALSLQAQEQLLTQTSLKMAHKMSERLEAEEVIFKHNALSYLNVETLGPPIIWTALLNCCALTSP